MSAVNFALVNQLQAGLNPRMSTATQPNVVSFPLERPLLRARWRDTQTCNPALPYFISGNENRLAHFVCQSDSDLFGLGNPILLTGPVGSGKTSIALHIAARQAIDLGIAHEIESVKYLPAIDFAREFAEAAASDDMPPFRDSIDRAPVLVIDDLHLIADKSPAQEELASRIEDRTNAEKPTVLTCRRLPSEVRSMRATLVSRALHGLTVPLAAPINEARLLVLHELSLVHDLRLDATLIDSLHTGLPTDMCVPELDAAIRQISLWCRMNDAAPCDDAVRSAVDQKVRSNELPLSKIAQTVARQMGLKTADLRSKSRKQTVVRARSLAIFLSRRLTENSLDRIGSYFGGRDHSTVLHAIRKTESLIDTDADLHRNYTEVSEKLSG